MPRPICCEMECTEDAEFDIWTEGIGVDPDDNTQACRVHVGDLLGWRDNSRVVAASVSYRVSAIEEEATDGK